MDRVMGDCCQSCLIHTWPPCNPWRIIGKCMWEPPWLSGRPCDVPVVYQLFQIGMILTRNYCRMQQDPSARLCEWLWEVQGCWCWSDCMHKHRQWLCVGSLGQGTQGSWQGDFRPDLLPVENSKLTRNLFRHYIITGAESRDNSWLPVIASTNKNLSYKNVLVLAAPLQWLICLYNLHRCIVSLSKEHCSQAIWAARPQWAYGRNWDVVRMKKKCRWPKSIKGASFTLVILYIFFVSFFSDA